MEGREYKGAKGEDKGKMLIDKQKIKELLLDRGLKSSEIEDVLSQSIPDSKQRHLLKQELLVKIFDLLDIPIKTKEIYDHEKPEIWVEPDYTERVHRCRRITELWSRSKTIQDIYAALVKLKKEKNK